MEYYQSYVIKSKKSKVYAINKHALRVLGSHSEGYFFTLFIHCETNEIQGERKYMHT